MRGFWWLGAALAACATSPGQGGAANGNNAGGAGGSAAETQCPVGGYWSASAKSCISAGPGTCQLQTKQTRASCVPEWCARWQTDAGAACQPGESACWLAATDCPAGPKCPAGKWPDPRQQGLCVAAGTLDANAVYWCPDADPAGNCPSTPCQAGEYRADGKCAPAGLPSACPPGFIAAPDGKGCVADPNECPTGKWPLKLPKTTVYVDAAAPSNGTGSQASPYKSLYAAINNSAANLTFALAAGDYVEQLPAKKSATVIGVCAAKVRIVAPDPTVPAVLVTAGTLQLQQVTLTGPGPGIIALGGNLAAQDVAIDAAAGYAISIDGAQTAATLQRVAIRNIGLGKVNVGSGISCSAGKLTGADISIANVHFLALAALNGAAVDVSRLRVSGIALDAKESKYGSALVAAGGSSLTVTGADLRGFTDSGLHAVGDGTQVQLTGAVLADAGAMLDPNTEGGYAVLAEDHAAVALQGCRVSKARGVGVLAHTSAQANLVGCEVADTQPLGDGALGWGAFYSGAASGFVGDSVFAGNRGVSVHVRDAGSYLRMVGAWINGTLPDAKTGQAGTGAAVQAGGRLEIEGSTIDHCSFTAVVASGAQSVLRLAGVLVQNTEAQKSSKMLGQGMIVLSGAQVAASGCAFMANREGGVAVTGAGSQLVGAGLRIEGTLARANPPVFGQGLVVLEQGAAVLRSSRLAGNHLAAAVVQKASLELDGCALLDSVPATWQDDNGQLGQQFADGLLGFAATHLVVRNTLIAGHPRAGLLLDSCADSEVANTACLGNLYGMVEQGKAAPAKQLGNALADNSQQNHATDKGLSVPTPPPLGKLEF